MHIAALLLICWPATAPACSAYDAILPDVYAALTGVVVASRLPDSAWYSAAESALTAIYTLHPAPEHLSAAMLRQLARRAFCPAPGQAEGGEAMEADDAAAGGGEEGETGGAAGQPGAGAEGELEGAQPAESQQSGGTGGQAPASMHSVVALTRFFFALGHVALQHLVRKCSLAAARRAQPLLCLKLGWNQVCRGPTWHGMRPPASHAGSLSTCSPSPCPPPHTHTHTHPPAHPPFPPDQVFVERAAKAVRRMRMDREKRAAEERAERMAAGRTPGKRRRPGQRRRAAWQAWCRACRRAPPLPSCMRPPADACCCVACQPQGAVE